MAAGAAAWRRGGEPPPSAYPNLLDITVTLFTTAAMSHMADMPPTVSAGDLLIAIVSSNGGQLQSQVATPTGWTLVATVHNNAANVRSAVFSRAASGAEGGTAVDFITTGNQNMIAEVFRYQATSWSGTPEAQTASFSFATPVSPPITPSWGGGFTSYIVGAANNEPTTSNPVFPYAGNNNSRSAGTALASFSCTTEAMAATLTPSSWAGITSFATTYTVAIRPA